MRYLGNKNSIVNVIGNFVKSKKMKNDLIFFDAFCGTGSVSDFFKNNFKLIINDNLELATAMTRGKIVNGFVHFKKLGFNPIDYFNNNSKTKIGFFSKYYAPALSGRMYFSDYNAGRIDYFRDTISKWKKQNKINDDEYYYLLACLLESVSKVSNVAGVYGAYLKHWDKRAIKKIKFIKPESSKAKQRPKLIQIVNDNIVDIIDKVECDIIYLDPPYTKNKYSVQYHILETLIRNDNPKISGITGSRKFNNVSNSWSVKNKAEIELDYIIAKTKAKYILLSYSDDGIMSKEYISSVFRRYGKEHTFSILEIPYKKYRNFKTNTEKDHREYLFYVEKKNESDVSYCCPLNYMGGKSNIIDRIKPYLVGKKKLIDIMAGGFNVGINASSFRNVIYNDYNFIVKELVMMFYKYETDFLLRKIESVIAKYNLKKNDSSSYLRLRKDYNRIYSKKSDRAIYLYTLILFGFQQQIRFNSNLEFNNPVGESGYNDSVKEKIVSFSRKLKELKPEFYSKDYTKFKKLIDKNTLVYIDPPYLITLGTYNDGKRGFKGWNEIEESRLLSFVDSIRNSGCKIVISNILRYKDKTNKKLLEWISVNKPSIYDITIRGRKEVLLVYEKTII